jgi:hypothetical protein
MLADLGGTNAGRWMSVGGLGYGSVEINHDRAAEIARHPLVRHVGVISTIRYAGKSKSHEAAHESGM